jgi:hypothetical protein
LPSGVHDGDVARKEGVKREFNTCKLCARRIRRDVKGKEGMDRALSAVTVGSKDWKRDKRVRTK